MEIKVDISSLVRGMDAAAERLRAGIRRGVTLAALQVEAAAKENLKGDPRGRHLMTSIHTEVQAEGDRVTGAVGVGAATGIDGEAGMNFGIYVHEGTGIYSRTGMGRKDVPWFYKDIHGEGHQTSGMEANPFLEKAYESEAPGVNAIVARAIMGEG